MWVRLSLPEIGPFAPTGGEGWGGGSRVWQFSGILLRAAPGHWVETERNTALPIPETLPKPAQTDNSTSSDGVSSDLKVNIFLDGKLLTESIHRDAAAGPGCLEPGTLVYSSENKGARDSEMSEPKKNKARVEKICLDNECSELWNQMPEECASRAKDFIYCPYCSEELHLQCSTCKEALSNKDFKFCPWCGAEF